MITDSDQLVKAHLNLVTGRHIQYIVTCSRDDIPVIFSSWTSSPSWNHAIVDEATCTLDDRLLSEIETCCRLSGRIPSVYFIDQVSEHSSNMLRERGYIHYNKEHWLLARPYELKLRVENQGVSIEYVDQRNLIEIKEYVAAFADGFQNLSLEYNFQLFLAMISEDVNPGYSSYCYLREDGTSTIVGVGSYYAHSRYAGIYNLAVKEEYRRKGFGKKLVSQILNDLKQRGTELVFLQSDNHIRSFYLQLGFHEAFNASIYTFAQ